MSRPVASVAATTLAVLVTSACVFIVPQGGAGPTPEPSLFPTPSATSTEPTPSPSPDPTDEACDSGWGTDTKSSPGMSVAPIENVRIGEHRCYERIVIDVQGQPPGYEASYVAAVHEDGSGELVPLRGTAFLQLTVFAPAYDPETGTSTYNPQDRQELADVSSYAALRQIALAGSFEGITTFGIGLDAQRPFRVLVVEGPAGGSRIALDVLIAE